MKAQRVSPLVVVLLALFGIITVLPIAVLVLGSFLSSPPRALHVELAGLTLGNYAAVLTDPSSLTLLGNTFLAAFFGTVGAVAVGTGLAWLGVRTDMPGRRVLGAVAILPMLVPPLVAAFAWDTLASPRNGMLNILARAVVGRSLFNLYSLGGITFVFALYFSPYVFLLMQGAFRNVDPSLEEAAAICGAGPVRVAFRIVLPLLGPTLLSAVLLVFVFLVELFAIPAVLGEPGDIHFMSVRIWELIGYSPPRINEASALGVLMLLVTMGLIVLQFLLLRRRSFVSVTGKAARRHPVALRGWRWPFACLAALYILLGAVLPFAALVIISLRRSLFFSTLSALFNPTQFSTAQWSATLSDPVVQLSLSNSLLVCLGTVAIGTVLFFTVSYIVSRTRLRGRAALDLVAMLPLALPGLVIGLGYLWTWISLPVGIYGTLWVMIVAYLSQFSPQAVRAIGGSLVQIHPELEESARVCGAGFLLTLRRVIVPLAWPGIQSAMILLLVFSFREVSTALFLYTSDTQVFSVTMFDYWVQGTTSSVAVMSLVQTAVLLVFILIGQTRRLA